MINTKDIFSLNDIIKVKKLLDSANIKTTTYYSRRANNRDCLTVTESVEIEKVLAEYGLFYDSSKNTHLQNADCNI